MLKGHWSVIDIAKDYYIVRFDLEEDYNHVLFEGPWVITGHYLAVQRWKPRFKAEEDCITHLTVWVQVLGLPVEWFDPHILKCIDEMIGATNRVDLRTSNQMRVNMLAYA